MALFKTQKHSQYPYKYKVCKKRWWGGWKTIKLFIRLDDILDWSDQHIRSWPKDEMVQDKSGSFIHE